MARPQPPRLAVLLLRVCLAKRSFEAVAGDLFEEYGLGTRSAFWFWKQALSALPRRLGPAPHLSDGPRGSRLHLLDRVSADLRYAMRTLRRTPSLTAAILIATALGIGVNAGIFSLINALALRPLPVKDAGRVVSVYQNFKNVKTRNVHGASSLFSWSEYEEYRDNNRVLSGLAAFAPFEATLGTADGARPVQGQLVSCNYFSVLGRTPVLGRDFSGEECKAPNASPYVVLSHAFWETHFGSGPRVLGQSVVVNRHKFTVIGVAPQAFPGTWMSAADFWAPITMEQALMPGLESFARSTDRPGPRSDPNLSWLCLLGRLKPGISVSEVRANLDVIAKRIDQSQAPRETKLIIQVASLFSLPEAQQVVFSVGTVVMLAVGLVLLIACANVANLLLARASVRQREIAVRLSMGATRARLVQQLLTESLLLSLSGGALGAIFSVWTFNAFYRWAFSNLPREVSSIPMNLSPDVRVLGFCLALSLATGIGFGLLPALQATRLDLNRVLKEESRSAGWRSRGWLRGTLLATQVAVCLVLLVAAGLITRGLIAAQALDPGFTTRNVVAASFDLDEEGYNEARATLFFQQVQERLRTQPGVQAVALALAVPLGGQTHGTEGVVDGHNDRVQLTLNSVSPDYFELLDIPIVRGRGFQLSENTIRAPVVIVSESTVRRLWPGADPLGKRIRFGDEKIDCEVIGVAKDVYTADLSEIRGIFVYRPVDPGRLGMSVLVRGKDPASLARRLRATVGGLDQNVLVNITELKDNLKLWQAPSRILVVLSSALGLFALLLAATGIFGVVNYAASQRTHEIGTRMALGASARNILRLVISQSMRPVLVGAFLGIAGAAAASRILTIVLFGVSPFDPLSFLGMLLLLFVVACLASYLPAHRAARIDPATALRHE
jgi:predicted permease